MESILGLSVRHHGADRLAGVHQVESLVDALKREHVGDEVVDVDVLKEWSARENSCAGAALMRCTSCCGVPAPRAGRQACKRWKENPWSEKPRCCSRA
jgi:hypothetical protein